MKPPEPETYILTLRPLPSPTPSVQRLRLLLKIALRAFAFKAERVTPVGRRPDTPAKMFSTLGAALVTLLG